MVHWTQTADNFYSKLKLADNGCLEWQGARFVQGYGAVQWCDAQWRAHRVAWLLEHGDLPVDMDVLHRCDNPPCCNIVHLFLGSQKDNIRDSIDKGRWTQQSGKTYCPQGHPYSEQNTYSWKPGMRRCRICNADIQRQRRLDGKVKSRRKSRAI